MISSEHITLYTCIKFSNNKLKTKSKHEKKSTRLRAGEMAQGVGALDIKPDNLILSFYIMEWKNQYL